MIAQKGARISLLCVVTVTALTVSACQKVPGANVDEGTAVQGNATPAPSSSEADPEGTVVELDASIETVEDLETLHDNIAVRSGGSVAFGSVEEFESGDPSIVDISDQCGDLNASAAGFVLACGHEVLVFDPTTPQEPQRIAVDEEFPVTAATIVSSGELFVGSRETAEVGVYVNGEKKEDYSVAAPTDQMLTVPHKDSPDGVIRTYGADTTIQNLDWGNSREGGRLRVGMGLGQAAAGDNGVVLVSDTAGKRLAVYTSTDAVRLHQFGNTDGIPWGVAWDSSRDLAWVTTTDNNQAQAFDISTGVPVPKATTRTVADAQHVVVTDSGDVVFGSASGAGLQIVTTPDIQD